MKVLIDIDEEMYRKGVLDFSKDFYILGEKWRDGENFTIFRTEEEAKARFMEIAKDIGAEGKDPEILVNDKDDMEELADGMVYSCGDNSVEIFKAPLEMSKHAFRVLGTEKDMTLQTVFSKEDVRTLVSDMEYSVYPGDVFSEEQLSQIDQYGWDKYLESVIDRLNQHFDAEDGLGWPNVIYEAQETYKAVSRVLRQKEKVGGETVVPDSARSSADGVVDIPLDGLFQAITRYDYTAFSSGNARGICGLWEVTNNSDRHDFNDFIAAYGSNPVFSCKVSEELTPGGQHYLDLRRECNLSDKTFSQICDTVQSIYMFARMAPEEWAKIQSNTQGR